MESWVQWAIGGIASVSVGGFMYLLGKIDKSNEVVTALGKVIDSLKSSMDNLNRSYQDSKKEIEILEKTIENKPDYKYVNDEFYRKEIAQIQIEGIKSDINEIKNDFRQISTFLEKIMEKLPKEQRSN
jgi:archaellum component FlaC